MGKKSSGHAGNYGISDRPRNGCLFVALVAVGLVFLLVVIAGWR